MEKNYQKWMPLKKTLNNTDEPRLFFHEREVWYCHLGENNSAFAMSFSRYSSVLRQSRTEAICGSMIANRHKKSTRVWIAGLISVLLFFVLPASAEAAGFTKAQTGVATQNANSSTISCAFASNPATGSLVTVGTGFYDTGTTPPTFTVADAASNSYTVDSTDSGSTNVSTSGYIGQAYLLSAPSNANKTITVTFSKSTTSSGVANIWCDNWTPSGGVATFDKAAFANGTGTINTPTITVSSANELVYCTASDAGSVVAATSPFTLNEGGIFSAGWGAEWVTGQSANRACAFTGTSGQVYNAVGMSFMLTNVTRTMRLFQGFRIKLISGRIILKQSQ